MKESHGKKHSKNKHSAHHRKPAAVHIPHSKNTKSETVEGNLIILGRGGGIVKCEEYKDGVRIPETSINMALHGDIVKAKVNGTIEG